MNTEQFFKSALFKRILFSVAAFAVLLGVFRLGMVVGFKKANFSFRWEENYHRNFLAPPPRNTAPFNIPWGAFPKDRFIGAHGTSGRILKIEENILIIDSQDNVEKSVLINEDTIIRRFRDNINSKELKAGEDVIIIGSPNEKGQIEAKLIRVMGDKMLYLYGKDRKLFKRA